MLTSGRGSGMASATEVERLPPGTLEAAREELASRPAHRATRSAAPWLLHKRMVPKWVGLVVTLAATLVARAPHQGWFLLLGVLLFFPSEYLVHRGVFHFFAQRRAGTVLSKQHVAHHLAPDDLDYLFNDPRISVSVGALYFLACLAATRSLGQSAALSLGNFAGLLYYEHVHFTAHRPGSRPWTPWGRYMKKFHLWHHFKHERLWFGVTSPLFDRIFGSYREQAGVQASPTVRTLVPTAEQRAWMGER
jgi:sterol desaturase/sphingolipid hydroxylase (fatty acid hydroxylase superfamily)